MMSNREQPSRPTGAHAPVGEYLLHDRAGVLLILGALFAASACGGRTSEGSGTGTLFCTIEVVGRPGSTRITTELKRAGEPVSDASLRFREVDSGMEVVADEKSRGIYRVEADGYLQTLAIEIVSGDDSLKAQLEGPAPHVITRPVHNSILRRADSDLLEVRWEAEDEAERVVLEVGSLPEQTIDGDPKSAEIPLGPLRSGEHTIEVTRETSVELRGGTSGSRMTTRYEVDNRFTLEG